MGILQKERQDPSQGAILRTWINSHVLPAFSERILNIDVAVVLRCAKLHIPDPKSERDSLWLRVGTSGAYFDLTNGTVSGAVGVTTSIENYGNGWYKCAIVRTSIVANEVVRINLAIGTNGTYTGDGTSGLFIWGAQLELGSYDTSYIPTTAATVTRNADVISKTGISSLIGQTEGTIFIDAQITNFAETAQSFITISDGTIFNRVELRKSSTSQIVLEGAASTGSFPGFTLSSVAVGRYKIAVAYQSGNSYLYINGAQVGTTSANAFAFTSLTNIVVGANATGSTRFLNDRINLATVFKTRLTPDQLILLTGASFSSYPEMANALIYTIQ
jgi:hypothetical protein